MRSIAFALILFALRPADPPVIRSYTWVAIPLPIVVRETIAQPPPPAPTPAHDACPSVVRETPRANPAHFPTDITHVSVALTDARWLAAWNDRHVFVSLDGGSTFTRVLDGPGKVTDVAFDCFGHAIVLRDRAWLGIGDRWQRVPGLRGDADDPNRLIGGGPGIVVLGLGEGDDWHARLAITSDLGASWSFRDLSTYYESHNASGRQLADGRIDLALAYADCMTDPMSWYAIDGDKVREDGMTNAPGPLYVHGDIAYSYRYWRRKNHNWRGIEGLPANVEIRFLGAVPRAIAGNIIYRVRDGVATPLRPWPENVELLAVDLAGRLWGADDGKLVVTSGGAAPIPPPCCNAE